MKSFAIALFLFTSMSANAALSGYYDSIVKIQAALSDSEVANSLRQQAITNIEVKGLTVIIHTATCFRGVGLYAIPPKKGNVGAMRYAVDSLTTNGCQ